MLPPSAIIQKGGFSMTEHEKYQEHIQHTHDVFCKTVIRHAAIDAARSIRSRRKREISLEYLIEEKHYPFSTTDKYFAEQSGMTSYPLFVCGQMVLLESPELADSRVLGIVKVGCSQNERRKGKYYYKYYYNYY